VQWEWFGFGQKFGKESGAIQKFCLTQTKKNLSDRARALAPLLSRLDRKQHQCRNRFQEYFDIVGLLITRGGAELEIAQGRNPSQEHIPKQNARKTRKIHCRSLNSAMIDPTRGGHNKNDSIQ
jgi:hypothetical protein